MKRIIGWNCLLVVVLSCASSAQKLTWNRIGGSTTNDVVTDIARDRVGNLYVSGYAPLGFDGQTNGGGQDAFVSKYDTNGVRLWTRIWGSGADDSSSGVCIDRQTNVYVCGQTAGSFHGETGHGGLDFFLTKWTADGDLIWTRIWGATNDDNAAGVAVDQANDVYVGGMTCGSFGSAGQTNARVGTWDFCLSKYSSGGSFQWSRIWGCTNSDYCNDMTIDPYDTALYLCGYSRNGIFEGQTNFYAYDRLALTAINTSGTRLWSRVWGATNKHNSAKGVSSYNYVYVAGITFGSFDGQTNSSTGGNSDFFVTQFDQDGTKNWTRIHGTNSIEEAYGVAEDLWGNANVLGVAYGDLDGQSRVGLSDFMLVKYDSTGARAYTRLWGTDGDDTAVDVVVENTNGIYTCGIVYKSWWGQTNPGADSAALSRWRQGPNVVPQATIQKPTANREFVQFESILCAGTGSDTDDGALTNLLWRFGTNSVFSSGPTATVSAAWAGAQTVTLYAVDTESGTGAASVVVSVYADGNGLPEPWQTNYWPNGDSGGPSNDYDNDGIDNFDEWQSGTDPTNAASRFQSAGTKGSGGPELVIQWPSVSNRDYTVGSSSNLVEGFAPLTTVPSTPPVNTYTTPASADPSLFYRVEVGR